MSDTSKIISALSDQQIGEKIKKLRESLGLSQKIAARRALCSERTWQRVEHGEWPKRRADRHDTETRVARVLGLTADDLMKREIPLPEPTAEQELSSDEVITIVIDFLTKFLQHQRKTKGVTVGEMEQEYAQITTPGERRLTHGKKSLNRD